jgi:RNA polymerase sigma-70 factor (ECF subfamily)
MVDCRFSVSSDYKTAGAAEYLWECLLAGAVGSGREGPTRGWPRNPRRSQTNKGQMIDLRTDFAALLRQHQTQLFGYIYSLVRDLDDADDLFQQTSLVLWDKFEQFDASKSFVSWACGVARYEVLNFLRARSRHRLYFSDELNLALIEAQESLEEEQLEERRDALAGCMKKLRQRDQELLEACYGRSVCIPEVARDWGRSSQSIHNSLRRIRRVLFECVRRTLAQGELA